MSWIQIRGFAGIGPLFSHVAMVVFTARQTRGVPQPLHLEAGERAMVKFRI
jgi:hypothetical protein